MSTYNIPRSDESGMDRANGRNEEESFDLVRRLGEEVINPGADVTPTKKDHVGVYVPSANYGGFVAGEARAFIHTAPGATFTKQVQVTGSVILSGAFLDCEGNSPAILIKNGGRAVVQNCHITKSNSKQTGAADSYIHVETGGYASVNGCIFHGLQSDVGAIVHNADAVNPGRVAVAGCVNLTDIVTTPYVNITYTQDVP